MTEQQMQKAITPIEMLYTNHRGKTEKRIVSPAFIYMGSSDHHPEIQWLMTAYCHDRRALRVFALKDCDFASVDAPRANWREMQDNQIGWMVQPIEDGFVIGRMLDGSKLARDLETSGAAKARMN